MLVRARVEFARPNVEQLRKKGFTAVDMHFHTRYSDSYTRVDSLLKRARALGIGVAITDHNVIDGALEAYRKRAGVLVIPGVEVTCHERTHLLVYFTNPRSLKSFHERHVKPYLNGNPLSVTRAHVADIVRGAKECNGMVVAAHPFLGFTGLYKVVQRGYVRAITLSKVNALEAINGTCTRAMDWKAVAWAEQLAKPVTAGSDGHTLGELGKVLTYAKAKTPASFLAAIQAHQAYVVGRRTNVATQLDAKTRIVSRHLRYIKPTISMRFEVTVIPAMHYHVPRLRRKLKKARQVSMERVRYFAARGLRRLDDRLERL